MEMKVDVCINVYGKPWQTIVTLKSLLAHCGEFIDTIFLIEGKKQPCPFDLAFVKKALNYSKIIHHKPSSYLKIKALDFERAKKNPEYWLSIRYQYGFDKTDKKYLLLLHNDVVFYKNFLTEYINYIDSGYVGIGELGQCWNCPMYLEKICNSDICQSIAPNYDDVISVIEKHPTTRLCVHKHKIDKHIPMPLPECRLNEWVALVDAKVYNMEIQNGVFPFGSYGMMDLGVENYRELILRGYKFKTVSAPDNYSHAYFSANGNGHSSMFNKSKYPLEEDEAREYYRNYFLAENEKMPHSNLLYRFRVWVEFV